ncbi:MAG: STM4015 family protein [Myxococcota bacterium]
MKRRELQFMDGKSSKFWRIELDGASHTVTYGRIGTDGTSKTKGFSTAEDAEASFEKLVHQKLAKGYADASSESSADSAAGDDEAVPFMAFACTTGSQGTYEHATNFMGLRVRQHHAGKKIPSPEKYAHFFSSDYDTDSFGGDLDDFLGQDAALKARALVLGSWASEMYEVSSSAAVKKLTDAADKLSSLEGIFVGDIIQEENEMSWIKQSDVSPLLGAFPQLQLLRVRGGEGLALTEARHPGLRALALETGGMDASVVRSVLGGDFPSLEYLELWLGTEEYGGTCSVEDLQPLLAGRKFPKLRYLGLRNCDFVDDIAPVVVNSPLLERIQTLDLSLGTLSDVGGQALLKLSSAPSLERLDLSHHFMTKPMTKQLKALPFAVDVSDAQEDDDDWRFVAVGE